jgi:hypothetical protein
MSRLYETHTTGALQAGYCLNISPSQDDGEPFDLALGDKLRVFENGSISWVGTLSARVREDTELKLVFTSEKPKGELLTLTEPENEDERTQCENAPFSNAQFQPWVIREVQGRSNQ